MGNCDIALDWISASLDGALTTEEQSALDAHLAECPACSALFNDICSLQAAAADLEDMPAPAGFAAAVAAAVAADPTQDRPDNVIPFSAKRAPRKHWQRWVASVAAVAVIAVGAASLPNLAGGNMAKGHDMAEAEMVVADAVFDSSTAMYSATTATGSATTGALNGSASSAEDSAAMAESSFAPEVGMVQPESQKADNSAPAMGAAYCGRIVLTGDILPEGLDRFEATTDAQGNLSYVVPVDYFYSSLETLKLNTPDHFTYELFVPAYAADADYGLIVIQP